MNIYYLDLDLVLTIYDGHYDIVLFRFICTLLRSGV
jgi:hypothetical protein